MVSRSAQEIWEAAVGELQIQVSKSNYRTWFEKTSGLSYEEDQFVVGVPNTFAAEYLDRNQRSLIEKVLIGLTSTEVRVAFHTNGRHHDAAGAAPGHPATTPAYPFGLNSKYVFDSFVEGSNNRMARTAALTVAQNGGHNYNPLFIYGEVGVGKTHLLHAIGHATLANHKQMICVTAEQFTNEFVSAIHERKTEEFRKKYRNAEMLLVDDIYFLSGKEQTEEGFFHIFNELHNANRQIVMTSDRPPKSFPKLEDRLRSRFEWGLVVKLKPPDFETRLAILQAKTREREASIDVDVLKFIAQQTQHNIRELEGSLNRVAAYARMLRVPPTVELAARALEDIAGKEHESTTITPGRLIEAVAVSFQLTPPDLRSRKRGKEIALARRVAMYLIRQETNCSLAQIGHELGGRDAAAVTNACKKIAADLDASPYLKRKITDIQQEIYPRQ